MLSNHQDIYPFSEVAYIYLESSRDRQGRRAYQLMLRLKSDKDIDFTQVADNAYRSKIKAMNAMKSFIQVKPFE